MDYALIGKIEKAKMYAAEPERFHFDSFSVRVKGDNDNVHVVTLGDSKWHCDCSFFQTRGYCSHTMSIERLLGGMVPQPAE